MAERKIKQRVFLWGGDGEHTSILALPALFSPEGSQNMHVTKMGELESMSGYSTLNAAAITTDTGASAVAVVRLYHYETTSGVTITRREVAIVDDGVNEVEIWHSTDAGATWSFLTDVGSGAVGKIPDMTQHESGTLIITFGPSVAVYKYNGTTASTAGQTQPSAPTAAAVANTAGNLRGVYQYKVAHIDHDGTPEIGPASAATAEVTVDLGRIQLTGLPALTADGLRIFRTTGDGKVYYKVTDVTSNANYTDNLSDRDLLDRQAEIEDHGDKPAAGMIYCETHRSRVFYADEDTIYPSDFRFAESVSSELSFKTSMGDGDRNRGMTGEFDGELIIWTEQSVIRLQGDGRQTWHQIPTAASIGTVHHSTVVRVPSNAKATDQQGNGFATGGPTLAYIAPDKTIRIFDGRSDTVISQPIKTTMQTMSYALRDQCWAIEVPSYEWVVFAIATAANTYTYVAWDYARGIWHKNIGTFWPEMRHAVLGKSSSSQEFIMGGQASTAVGGKVYQLFTGNSADGSSITATFRSVPLPGPTPQNPGLPDRAKIHMGLQVFYRPQSSALNATVNVYKGFASTGASAYVTFTQSMQATNVNVADPAPVELMDSTNARYIDDEAIVLEITRAGTASWAVFGWAHEFIIVPDTVVR